MEAFQSSKLKEQVRFLYEVLTGENMITSFVVCPKELEGEHAVRDDILSNMAIMSPAMNSFLNEMEYGKTYRITIELLDLPIVNTYDDF